MSYFLGEGGISLLLSPLGVSEWTHKKKRNEGRGGKEGGGNRIETKKKREALFFQTELSVLFLSPPSFKFQKSLEEQQLFPSVMAHEKILSIHQWFVPVLDGGGGNALRAHGNERLAI